MTAERTVPTGWGEPRTREVTWHDPAIGAGQALRMPGLDYLRAIQHGELPPAPIATHFDFAVTEVEPGHVSFTCTPDESAYNPIGVVHGGLVCTLLDSVCGCAVHSTLPLGKGYTSIEIKVSYLKAVTARSGLLIATGTLVTGGLQRGRGHRRVRRGGRHGDQHLPGLRRPGLTIGALSVQHFPRDCAETVRSGA
jgi:uncharacterized protein (TIGR00369 family)